MAFTLTGARDDLAGALALASRFTSAHKSNPQLNNLRVCRTADGDSFVEATDQRSSIRTALWAQGTEAVDVLVSPDLTNAVKAMSQGDVQLTKDGTQVIVSGKGKAKYSVGTLDKEPADAFPGEDEVDWSTIVPIDASEALDVMEVSARYASKQESNPSIVGVNLRVIDQELGIESTDGSRLFHDRVALPSKGFPFDEDEVMLPPRMVTELNRIFPSGEVAFAATANLFFARDPKGETLFASRRIGGKFPNVEKIVPEYKGSIAVPCADLREALDRMRTVVGGKPVRLTFSGKELKLESKAGAESAEEYVDLPQAVEPDVEIAFPVDSLAEAASLFSGELRLSIDTPLKPMTMRSLGPRFFLLAPVKFNR